MALTFEMRDVMTRKRLGQVGPKDFKFNDPVYGFGSCEFSMAIPKSERSVESLKGITVPDRTHLYIKDGDNFVWDGILTRRGHVPGSTEVKFKVQQFGAWFYSRTFYDTVNYGLQDDFLIVQQILTLAKNTNGFPPYTVSLPNLRGVSSEFSAKSGWTYGQAMDNFSQRDNGFEYSWGTRGGSADLPENFIELWTPGQRRSSQALLMLDKKSTRNKVTVGEIAEDSAESANVVIAFGGGQDPDQVKTYDRDPLLNGTPYVDGGTVLLREIGSSYSGITNPATLYQKARAERVARSQPASLPKVDLDANRPKLSSYRSGDRVRLRVSDDWGDYDWKGARIIDRAVSQAAGGYPIATLSLNLNDVTELK